VLQKETELKPYQKIIAGQAHFFRLKIEPETRQKVSQPSDTVPDPKASQTALEVP